MILDSISDLILSRLADDDLVLDVGGGRFPWFRATHVIDRRPYDGMVGPPAFGGRDGERPRFDRMTWLARDFYDFPWPYEDNRFDFVLCMGTLEDVRDPLPLCREIARVGKAGYISMPTRACESCVGVARNDIQSELPGYFHHRWWVEIDGADLRFTMKHHLPLQHRRFLIREYVQHTLNFFWNGTFTAVENNVSGGQAAIDDLARFAERHRAWVRRCEKDRTDGDGVYNSWPSEWGSRPAFLDLPGVADVHPSELLGLALSRRSA